MGRAVAAGWWLAAAAALRWLAAGSQECAGGCCCGGSSVLVSVSASRQSALVCVLACWAGRILAGWGCCDVSSRSFEGAPVEPSCLKNDKTNKSGSHSLDK
jgi:hypothetical protein